MPAVKTYDPAKVIVAFGGVPLTGFADGTFISIEPASDRWTKVVGADGEVARSKTNNRTHKIALTLLQSSLSNAVLSAAMALDDVSNRGVVPLAITDMNGTSLYLWKDAWISKDPTSEFAKELGDREWTIETGQIVLESINGN